MKSYYLTELKYQLKQVIRKWAKPALKCLIALIISIGTILFWITDIGQRLDLWVLQKFFEVRGPLLPPKDVLIIAIDDESYAALDASPRLPFPRILVAKALEEIVKGNPKTVIIDANIPREKQDIDADNRLEAALSSGPTTLWSGRIPQNFNSPNKSNESDSVVLSSEERFVKAAKMELPMLLASTQGIIANISLSKAASAPPFERVPLSRPLIELAHAKISIPNTKDLINFYGPSGTLNRISLHRLLESSHEHYRDQLKDKIVFLGFQSIARGRGQIDKEEMPISGSEGPMFGVEIHATVAANLIEGNWLKRYSTIIELSILYITVLIIALFGIAYTPERGIPILLFFAVVVFAITYFSFAKYHLWFGGIGSVLFATLLTVIGNSLCHYILIKRFKSYIERTFKFDLEKQI